MGKYWDQFKKQAGDQVRGSMKHGASTSIAHNMAAQKAARAEREAREAEAKRKRYAQPSRAGGYFSQTRNDGKIDIFIGPDGDITAERPHVHVIHSDPEGKIFLVATLRDGRHVAEESLPADASGNDVNAAVDRLRRLID